MVRILHTSDWHVGRAMRGISRAEEHRRVLDEMADLAADRRVDLVVVAGDLFDQAAPTPEAEHIVYRGLLRLAEVAPVLVVAGNHDNPRRLEAVAPLLSLGRIHVASHLRPPDEGGVVDYPDLGVRVVTMPWVRPQALIKAEQMFFSDPPDRAQTYAAKLDRVARRLSEEFVADRVNLAVAHLSVYGAEPSGSERAVRNVFEYAVPASAWEGASYVALGHFHRPQRVDAPGEVWYSGSPLQLDFGEAGEAKSVAVVEAEPGLPPTIEQVPLQGGRRLVVVQGSLDEVVEQTKDLDDCFVKVILHEKSRVGLAEEVRELVPGVVEVQVAKSEHDRPSRPSRRGRSPVELFAEYLSSRSIDDPELVAMFTELLEQVDET
ncbi:MAG: nuclease SbcCD subunit D [Acidimicrobiia bacterium]|nr:MAG: nuclease SbcCD subunit D [Acidimicrobiia bacterium]